MHIIRKHILAEGYVQGVGFRFSASHCARRHYLTGWVRNLEDGRVELEVQGDAEDVADFLAELDSCSRYATVINIWEEDIPVIRESDFHIR